MRSALLVALVSVATTSPLVTPDVPLHKLHDGCRALGGASEESGDAVATHAECRDGLSIILYRKIAVSAADGRAA